MKNILAILAVAFVATAPALAADSIASTDDDEEPTMGELAGDIAELSGKLDTVLRAVGNLAPEVAVVMTIPTRLFKRRLVQGGLLPRGRVDHFRLPGRSGCQR